jgi:hypothetical protein
MKLGDPIFRKGPLQGRLDQEIILAVRQSANQGGEPIKLPLENG